MTAQRWYQVSKCSFLMVLLLPFGALGSAQATADLPRPYSDCGGMELTPDGYQAFVNVLERLEGSVYSAVFDAPFQYCDELPLFLETVPSNCQVVSGHRKNWDGTVEEFTFEAFELSLSTGSDLEALGGLTDPTDAATWSFYSMVTGPVAGYIRTAKGGAGVSGLLLGGDDADGVRRSVVFPLSALTFRQLEEIGRWRQCAGAKMLDQGSPIAQNCWGALQTCKNQAHNNYYRRVNAANVTFASCIGGVLSGTAGFFWKCFTWCGWAGSTWCIAGCTFGGLALGGWGAYTCDTVFQNDMANAQEQLEDDLARCEQEHPCELEYALP